MLVIALRFFSLPFFFRSVFLFLLFLFFSPLFSFSPALFDGSVLGTFVWEVDDDEWTNGWVGHGLR